MNPLNLDKTYFEIYALLSMEFLSPTFPHAMRKGESPDWQDMKNNIGFEVTKAESSHVGYAHHVANQFLGKHKSEIPQRILEDFSGELYFEHGKLHKVFDGVNVINDARHIEFAISAIARKTTLLNKPHFHIFRKNYVYLFLTNFMIGSDLDLFCEKYYAIHENYEQQYDTIVLFDNGALYLLHTASRKISKIELNNSDLAFLKQTSQRLRNTSEWEDGSFFIDVKRKIAK